MKKPVRGVGINDSVEPVYSLEGGKKVACDEYQKWVDILRRCYSPEFQSRNQSYIGCTITDEWVQFSAFRTWVNSRNFKGLDIDKDILSKGNKIYGPQFCAFVPRYMNILLTVSGRDTALPVGVHHYRAKNPLAKPYVVNGARRNGGKVSGYFGYFATPEEAHAVWQEDKVRHIEEVLARYRKDDCYLPEIDAAVILRAADIRSQLANGEVTTCP